MTSNGKLITQLPVREAENGVLFLQACHRVQPCGCEVIGAGTLTSMLDIKFCHTHAAVAELLDACQQALGAIVNFEHQTPESLNRLSDVLASAVANAKTEALTLSPMRQAAELAVALIDLVNRFPVRDALLRALFGQTEGVSPETMAQAMSLQHAMTVLFNCGLADQSRLDLYAAWQGQQPADVPAIVDAWP